MKSKRSFYISWFISLVFCITAFALLYFDYTPYGISLFCIFPLILGISTGIIPDTAKAFWGTIAGLFVFFLLLLALGFEGVICLVMATPIIGPFVFLGYLIAYLVKKYRKNKSSKIYISIVPFLLFVLAAGIEKFMGDETLKEEVTTSIILPHSPELIYDEIIHVDTVAAKKGFLHQLGLPVPLNCTLTEEKIGGLRICEFEDGRIIETITALEKGKYLEMDVTSFELKGRPWLHFNQDIYSLEPADSGTKISRTTSYTSELKPRMYWRFIEALTIEAEQDLVFRNLKLDLDGKH